jgi:hypothetical protein
MWREFWKLGDKLLCITNYESSNKKFELKIVLILKGPHKAFINDLGKIDKFAL